MSEVARLELDHGRHLLNSTKRKYAIYDILSYHGLAIAENRCAICHEFITFINNDPGSDKVTTSVLAPMLASWSLKVASAVRETQSTTQLSVVWHLAHEIKYSRAFKDKWSGKMRSGRKLGASSITLPGGRACEVEFYDTQGGIRSNVATFSPILGDSKAIFL